MTIWYSDQITNRQASPPVMNEFNRVGGRVKFAYGRYAMGGSELITEVIQMVVIPKGAIVMRNLSHVAWTDLGGTMTIDVGDGDDDDRYCSGLTGGSDSAALTTFEEAIGAGLDYIPYEYTAEDTIDVLFDAATTPNATGIIYMHVFYTQNG